MPRLAYATATAVAVLAFAGAARADTNDFLTKAIKGDNSETQLGQLAEQKGASPRVRAFGRMLVTDHTRARQQATQIAQRHNIPAPTDMMPEAQEEYQKLQGMSGQAFDTEFASYMVQDHQHDISDFQKETKESGDPADVRALASRTLPTLHKHLKMAQSIHA